MGFKPAARPSHKEAVNEFIGWMKSTLDEARAALSKSKEEMAQYYNRRRSPAPQYKPGDKVFLNSLDIRTTRPSQKLGHQYLGPYSMVKAVGKNVYRLKLPNSMHRIHPVFHVVKLLPAPEDPIPGRRAPPPPEPEIVDGNPEYELEAILDSRIYRGRLQYLVSWKGFGYEENSWTNETDVNAPRLTKEFYRDNPGAPRRIRAIRFGSIPFRLAREVTRPEG